MMQVLASPARSEQQPSKARVLRMTHLELEGFKSFRDRAMLGPLDDFTCVVGPNGCGKSVVGEAVAFALGGNRKMLRTGSLAGLLNQQLAAAGQKTAEVVLHMELLPQQSKSATRDQGMASSHATAGADCDTPIQDCQQQEQQEHQPNQQQVLQQLKLKRVLRGDTTKSYIQRPGSTTWSSVSQAQLQAELAPYGIDTQVVDRYIVTQSRQAVDVSDAVGLAKQLEALTGAVDYKAAIQQHSSTLEHLAAGMEDSKAEIGRLEDERELLAPAVAHWQQVQQLEAAVSTARLQLLQEQQEHGSKLIKLQGQQVQAAHESTATAQEALQSAQQHEQSLLQQRAVLDGELLGAKKKEGQLHKKAAKLSAAAAAAEVQHAAATAALQDQDKLLAALQKKLAQHDKQAAQHKQQVEDTHQLLRQLQETSVTAQGRLADARKAAGLGSAADARKQRVKGDNPGSIAADDQVKQHEQQLAELDCELLVLMARQAAAAAKATQAARSVEVLQQKAQAASDAKAKEQQLRAAAEQEVQVATAAAAASRRRRDEAEQHWRSAEDQQQALTDQLDEVQQNHNHHHHHQQQQQQQYSSMPGSLPAYDRALQHLSAASAAGQLPGQFHGRLCNLAAVSDPSAHLAVNAALQERCNMATMMVVSDRATAAAVIDHFRQNRIGTVNCKILSELQQQRGSSRNTAAASNGSSRPLLDLVQYDSQAVPGLQHLMEQLLGGWLLVETREVALQLLHQKQSMVTRSGEVFKADGEIVASFGGPSRNRSSTSTLPAYSLAVGQPTPIPNPTRQEAAQAGSRSSQQGPNAAREAAAAAEQVKQLKQQLLAAQEQAQRAGAELQAAQLALLQHEQQQTAAEAKLRRLQQHQQYNHGRNIEQLQQQSADAMQWHQTATSNLTAADAALAEAQQHRDMLMKQVAAAQAGADIAQAAATNSEEAAAATAAAAALQEAEEEAAQAAAAVEAAWREADRAKQQQKRASSRAAAISKEIAKAQAAVKPADMDKLQEKLDSFRQQLSDTQSELQQVKQQVASTSSSIKPLKAQLLKAAAAKDKSQAALEKLQVELCQAQATLQEVQEQQQSRAQALQLLTAQDLPASPSTVDAAPSTIAAEDSCKRAKTADTATEASPMQQSADQDLLDTAAHADMDVDPESGPDSTDSPALQLKAMQGGGSKAGRPSELQSRNSNIRAGQRTRARARVILDSSSGTDADSEGTSSDNDEDDVAAPAMSNRAAAASRAKAKHTPAVGRRQREAKLRTADQLAAADGKLSAAVLAKQTAQLQQRQLLLDDQEQELQQQYARVDQSALERDLAALQGLAAAHTTLKQLQQQHEAAATALELLLDERYSRLLAVLQSLNAQLDTVYSQLTGGIGKAYCSYTAERRLLFSQGVTLHVQPDGSTWRRLGMLSGGQKSLATLALSFALQTLFPSPFYFFDEVDCALDTSAAGRVAAYVQQCRGPSAAQYLLVSHKPVVFESAGCLLGVYSNGRGSSAAVVGHFTGAAAQ